LEFKKEIKVFHQYSRPKEINSRAIIKFLKEAVKFDEGKS